MIDAAFGTPLPSPPSRAAGSSRIEHAWAVLSTVLDPEVPVVSVVDLGIVRAVIDDAGLGPTRIRMQRAPAWTSDWISDAGKAKLRGYGIVPPGPVDLAKGAPLRFVPRAVAPLACPRCESTDTERLAAFGATACKALWRCRACGEPFEHFKAI